MNEDVSAPRRPGVVTAAAVLLYVVAGFGLVGVMTLYGADATTTGTGTVITLAVLGLVIAFLAVATLILGGSNSARVTAIVLLSISSALELIEFDLGSLVSIGLALVVIGLLACNRDANEFFAAHRRPSHTE
ncbi:hypothetical protein [Actinophytocola sp. NPDC049390]|uniref:hypothetical protein n=1 Tax=Actinophytocola sp. NPDC049390 TaxID=3363894 RepID=UPI0037B8CEDC